MPTETAATSCDSGDLLQQPLAHQAPAGQRQRHVAAGDRRRARAAVGLQHVAVDGDRALPERWPCRSTRAARGRSAARSPCRARPAAALAARVGRARQHGVLAGDPALAAVLQERRHPLLDRGGADDPGLAGADRAPSPRDFQPVGRDGERAQLVRASCRRVASWARGHYQLLRAVHPRSARSRRGQRRPRCDAASRPSEQRRALDRMVEKAHLHEHRRRFTPASTS